MKKALFLIVAVVTTLSLPSCIVERSATKNDWGYNKGANKGFVPIEVSSRHYR